METKRLKTTLRGIAGHLVIETDEQERNYERLVKSLGCAFFPDEKHQLKRTDFSIEKADLFFDERIPKKRLEDLDVLASKTADLDEPAFRVFVREVPIREQLIHGSVPDWAAGAKVDHSVGPFKTRDGRQFWYDFFRIEKLTALYIQGIDEPVLLFRERKGRQKKTDITSRYAAHLSKTYHLSKGSIWINAKFLAFNAPAGNYSGLTIQGGTITLSSRPVKKNEKLTVTADTTITVQLALDQPEVTGADKNSPYGVDARKMELQLPQILEFHFSAHGRSIDAVSDAHWALFGQPVDFRWDSQQQTIFNAQLGRILFPFSASEQHIEIKECASVFNCIDRSAAIINSAWALPVAQIDITQPTAASGSGGMLVQGKEGLLAKWKAIKGGGLNLSNPVILSEPSQILVADLTSGNPHAHQSLDLWQDEINQFGTKVDLRFPSPSPFFFTSNANGVELLLCFTNADFQVDRPVKVDGEPPAIRSLNSLLLMAVSEAFKLIYLFDDNLIQDDAQSSGQDIFQPEPMALAMTNALFKVSPVNGCLLFGTLSDDFTKVESGFLFLTFGLFAYLPTLPDPYAANLGILKNQVRGIRTTRASLARSVNSAISAWLVCRVKWDLPTEEDANDEVEVSFHFAPLSNQFGGISLEDVDGSQNDAAESASVSRISANISGKAEATRLTGTNLDCGEINNVAAVNIKDGETATRTSGTSDAPYRPTDYEKQAGTSDAPYRPPNYEEQWEGQTSRFSQNLFALLDVSTNADLFGISFNLFSQRTSIRTHVAATTASSQFPLQIEGLDVVSSGQNVKAFTVPQISWEPVINLSPPDVAGDPPAGLNYYPDDGGPMQIINSGEDSVALAPLPLTDYLISNFEADPEGFAALSLFTLPFGLKAAALLQNKYVFSDQNGTVTRRGTDVLLNSEAFGEAVKGGLQLQLNAGEAIIKGQGDMFAGATVQLNNVLDLIGNSHGDSTLGRSVTLIFNNEFMSFSQRGVPLTRMDLSGYGASTFSNWLNPKAAMAETSQARFDVFVGRCAHEIIQVRSIMYPWAIKVVRTITMFRVGSSYVYRFDSGWQPESDGEFFLNYYIAVTAGGEVFEMPTFSNQDPGAAYDPGLGKFEIHPGIIKGLFNVRDIQETDQIAVYNTVMTTAKIVSNDGLLVDNPDPNDHLVVSLQPVYFTADVEIENAVSGFNEKNVKGESRKLVPSKKILGYVQIAPKGLPLSSTALRDLVQQQQGAIGGPIDCEINLANSDQKMRLNRFDFNNSFGDNGTDIAFAVAGRGNVLLPKDGSWSMVKHERDTGDVSPVPSNLSVPVIRQGKLERDGDGFKLDTPIASALLRIANPKDLLRQPGSDTINFGFLQNTDTQKALFLTPAFQLGEKNLFSKTPPLFVDAFRIVNTKSIFPNIGDAESNLGEAISLIQNGNEFVKGALQDIGQDVWTLMEITDTVQNAKQQGYKLLKEVATFDLPNTEFELIDLGDGNFRIYIEYKSKDEGDNDVNGDLDFDIDSLADTWKSRMGNIGLVVDLAGIDRLMTIRGSWDSEKGTEASYPQPKVEFAPELEPVIEILEILEKLQGGDYAGAVAGGLKLAMSNKAGSWEYKFEASKEIPILRFPVPDAIYNDPNTPFKLEAGLKIGAYFNAALKVTTDANELLPSAGGYLGFYGRLSVMCVSLSAATIYAIGQVNLDIAADTKIGPSLRMKFGFGAQIVVGLPVAGNVSVMYVVGVEIFAASGILEVSAFMLFEGHAEILGGLVGITIRIEAKGTIARQAIGDGTRTDMACQVTFGLDISIFLVIDISFETSWSETRQIAGSE